MKKFYFILSLLLLILGCSLINKKSVSSAKENKLKIAHIARLAAHKTLDPMRQFDSASAEIIGAVYDTLLTYEYLERPYKLRPRLLVKMPSVSKDGLLYMFTLRKGVKFMDDPCFKNSTGRELTSSDVIYSLKRYADSNVNQVSYSLLQGTIVGMNEFRSQTQKLGVSKTDYNKLNISGIKVIDKYNFSIKLTKANPLFLYPLATTILSIVPKEAVEKYQDDFARHPVGTGPFTIEKYSRRGTIVLAKNPNYFGRYPTKGEAGDEEAGLLKDAGKQLPFMDKIELPLIEETQPRMLKFKKGELDIIDMNKDDFNQMALKDKSGKLRLNDKYAKLFNAFVAPNLVVDYMSFNMKDSIIGKNVNLRKAIAYALNRKNYVDLIRNGRAIVSNSIVPVAIAGSEKDTKSTYYSQNLIKAKEYLKKAGYPGGKGLAPLIMQFRTTAKRARQAFEVYRNELAKVGIILKGNFQTFSSYIKRVEAGNFQIANSGWKADYPDAENFYQLVYGPNKSPGPNSSTFNNKEYNALYEKSRFMINSKERYKIFARMNEIIKEEVPIFIVVNRIKFGLYQKNVKNIKLNVMVDEFYTYMNIE